MSGPLSTILPSLAYLEPIVQDNTLIREFYDALTPRTLFRMDATPEKWLANQGEKKVMTRASLLPANVIPSAPGVDPVPQSPSYEQWSVTAQPFNGTIDTHMPASWAAQAPLVAQHAKMLAESAGRALNRVARNKLFSCYLGGDTMATALGSGATSLPVSSINGFTTTLVNGVETPVSATNPKTITISGVSGTRNVTAATPDSADRPFGPGTLTLSASATWAEGAHVLASDASRVYRAGGAATVDSLTTSSLLTMADIRRAVADMRANNVPTHSDGYYHVHIDPRASAQLFGDNELQRMLEGSPDSPRYAQFAVGRAMGCLFFENSDAPSYQNTADVHALITTRGSAQVSSEINAEVTNTAGVPILRTIITGGSSMIECYVDESEFATEAGYTGKVGQFTVGDRTLSASVDRIRYIIRAPLDRLQNLVSQTWSATLDYGIPSDLNGGLTAGRFKRAAVIESGADI